jgi:hypothetical protein
MIKRKRTKGQTTIYQTLHRKLKIEQHERKRKQFLLHKDAFKYETGVTYFF